MKVVEPEIGCWYRSALENNKFEVVAIDETDETIAIQFFEGDIEEIDSDSWYRLELSYIPAPEDCSGPYEIEAENLGQEIQFDENWGLLSNLDGEED